MVTVVLRENAALEPEALIRFCNGNMAYFMVPRYVEFAVELPRTMSQKVEKYKLRQAAETRLAELWDRERAGIMLQR
jgi:carnitine-CoA ligase